MISCYQIEDVLGRGGFAVTYLAVDLNLDVHVAIKEYLPREIIQRDDQLNVSARRPEFVEDYNIGLSNFAREAKTLARFKHLNIVRVHQVVHKYNTAYMVMDYEQGQEFAEVLGDQQTLSEEALREILFPIFDGVEEIHRHGLAHRDIKPSNIYLRDNGSPVLLDFGAARYTLSETTQQLTAVVTVGYTPIEQYNVSDNDQGPWSDIYALAAVLYEAVTGEMPVDSVTRASSVLTTSNDPLPPAADKAQQHYSEDFLRAIDWGLHMEAEDRPQSIEQWRDAFNGIFKPATAYLNKKPAGRPSKLKTRSKDPLPPKAGKMRENAASMLPPPDLSHEQHPSQVVNSPLARTSPDTTEPHLSVDVGNNRMDSRFDHDLDDVEIIPLNPSHSPSVDTGNASNSFPTPTPLAPRGVPSTAPAETAGSSPFASNPANVTPQPSGTSADYATDQQQILNGTSANQAHNETLQNIATAQTADNKQTTHTQEIRNVLRRDIMKRDPDNPPEKPPAANYPPPYGHANGISDPDNNIDNPRKSGIAQRGHEQFQTTPPAREPVQRAPVRNEIEFDDNDWNYEPPAPPSKWRWVVPTVGLMAIVGASVLFVNRPELFNFSSAPEMTTATAIEKAQQQMDQQAIIFPVGESALDYYQLILSSDPANTQALEGISRIQTEVKRQIIDSIDADDLPEANRLLSRANDAGLQIDGLPNSSAPAVRDQPASSEDIDPTNGTGGNLLADTYPTLSPWLTGRITDIEKLIGDGNLSEAETLFSETDKYIADAALSQKIRDQIAAAKTDTSTPQSTDDTAGPESRVLSPETVDTDLPLTPVEVEAVTSAPEVVTSTPAVVDEPLQTENTVAAITAPIDQDVTPAIDDPEPLPSAPRQSFISGNDATAQHLNQLRTAIESKNLNRVLQVSDSLPDERTEFLRKMFQRYDRLDVSIDNISTNSSSATARLSVAMFNQRGDGSYYSAGKWNGVNLTANQQNGVWQKIKW